MYLQAYLHSMYHRNYACICGPDGLKLTETHPVKLKSIWDNLDITDFLIITDITDFCFFTVFEDEKNLDAIIITCAVFGSLMGT